MRNWLRLLLVTMTVGGGFAGLILTLSLFKQVHTIVQLIVVIAFLGLYGFVAACGLLLVIDERRTRPLVIALSIQIPWITTPVFVYQFASAMYVALTIGTSADMERIGINWNFLIGSHFLFRASSPEDAPWHFGLNLVPIALLALLFRSERVADEKFQSTQAKSAAPASEAKL